MSPIRIDIRLDESVSDEEAKSASVALNVAFENLEEFDKSDVRVIGPDRSFEILTQTIAVAAPVITNVADALKALLELFSTLRKQKSEKDCGEQVLAAIPPENILVRVGRGYIPLDKLTVSDLEDM